MKEAEQVCKDILNLLRKSGIVTKVQDFCRNNPDYWGDTTDGQDKISGCSISIACVNKEHAIPNAVPFMSVSIGTSVGKLIEVSDHTLTTYSNHDITFNFWQGKDIKHTKRVPETEVYHD